MAAISTVWYMSFALLGLWNGRVVGETVPDVSLSLQDILNQAHQGPLYTYPTSLTQGIVPVCRIFSAPVIVELDRKTMLILGIRKEFILIMIVS